MSPDVDLQQLRYFVAVVDERSFTAAARRLSVSQQVVSRQVAELERRLGVRLVERTTRRVWPTAVGEVLHREAGEILERLDTVLREVRSRGGRSDDLTLGYFCSTVHADAEIEAFRKEHPQHVVRPVACRPTTAVHERVRSGELHAGLAWWPLLHRELDGIVLTEDRPALAVRVGHPLAEHPAAVAAGLVAPFPIVAPWLTADPAWLAARTGNWRPAGPRLADRAMSTVDEALETVRHSDAVYPMPASTIGLHNVPGVEYRLLEDAPLYTIGIVWRREDPRAPTKALVGLLADLGRR